MKIVKLKDFDKKYELCQMWNTELGFIFPITKELFDKNVYHFDNNVQNTSFVALIDNETVGFVIGKTWNSKYEVSNYDDFGWISLIYVKPNYRNIGVGSALLKKVEEIFVSTNKTTIHLGRDYCNFFPGLPTDLKLYRKWFEKRGYLTTYDTNDLIKFINVNTLKETLKPYKDHNNYIIRRATNNDLEKLGLLIKNNWQGRWYMEFLDYLDKGGTGYEYMICLDDLENVCGFCKVCDYTTPRALTSYSLNFYNRFDNLGGIGPLGVDINYRKRNIANNILKTIINELIDKNVKNIIIDWTNLMHIYRNYGFEIWKSYSYMSKDLKK